MAAVSALFDCITLPNCKDALERERDMSVATPHLLGRVLLDSLCAHGVREIFGIPGDFVLPLLQGDRRKRRAAVLHVEPRALGRVCRRCGGAAAWWAVGCGRDLGGRRVQPGERRGRRLCGAGARRGDQRCTRCAGAAVGLAAAPHVRAGSTRRRASSERSPATWRCWTTRRARPRTLRGCCGRPVNTRCQCIWSCHATWLARPRCRSRHWRPVRFPRRRWPRRRTRSWRGCGTPRRRASWWMWRCGGMAWRPRWRNSRGGWACRW